MFLVELGSWNPIRHCLEISSLIPLKRPPENVSPSEFQCFLDTCKRSNETSHRCRVIVIRIDAYSSTVGLLTCYDIRFPEVAQILRTRGADMLTYPSAFTVRTGAAHWEVLLRSRAIETQTYVIGAAAAGQHTQTRTSWGHAMVMHCIYFVRAAFLLDVLLMLMSDRSWIHGEQSWHSAMTFSQRNRLSVLRTST